MTPQNRPISRLDEYVAEDNPVRAADGLDLDGLGFIHRSTA